MKPEVNTSRKSHKAFGSEAIILVVKNGVPPYKSEVETSLPEHSKKQTMALIYMYYWTRPIIMYMESICYKLIHINDK